MRAKPSSSSSEIRVAVAGLGIVGSAVVRVLQDERKRYREELGVALRLVSILDRSYHRKDTSWIAQDVEITDSLEEFLKSPADIVVELIGGVDPAEEIVCTCLKQRKAVVTANKLLMARSGRRYFELAAGNNAFLGFEASVAGGIPIVRALRRSLFSDQIIRLRGILNGTCNFILTEMAKTGGDFQEVLAQAQTLGYAEADPELDISGRDTTDKLVILAALSFGKWIESDQIPTRGITEVRPVDMLYARKLNCTIKLLGIGEEKGDGACVRVSPFLIDDRLPLSKISGVLNAIEVTGANLEASVFSGRGAGGNPTAVSVVADILNAALWKLGVAAFHFCPIHATDSADSDALSQEEERYPFYLRFFVKDRPGIIASLSRILADREINIDSVLQEKWPELSDLPFIITVEETAFSTLQEAVAEMAKLEFNNVPPLALPILVPTDH